MTCHVRRAFCIRFRLQVVHQPIVEGKSGFGCAIDGEKFVTRQSASAFMVKRFRSKSVNILQVENKATQQFGEKFAFCNAVAVEVSEPDHRLGRDRVEIVVGYLTLFPIEPVLIRAVRRAAVGTVETERFGHLLAATESTLTTISYWRPLKNSKAITTSISADIIVYNDETKINYLYFIESWS